MHQEKNLAQGDSGKKIQELQLRLTGFHGTYWDGQFGPGTELQVITFQRDFMEMKSLDGIVGPNTFKAPKQFARDYPVRFAKLKCPCGTCEGFGQQRFNGNTVMDKKGWSGKNQKALEPSSIAPSWIHMDVRSCDKTYLKDNYFVTNATELNHP